MDMRDFIETVTEEKLPDVEISGRGQVFIDQESLLAHRFSVDCESCLLPASGGDVDLIVDFTLSMFNEPVQIPSPDGAPILLIPDDHGNEASSATPLLLDQEVDGVIDPRGDVDFFKFEAEVGQSYFIPVKLFDADLALYDTVGVSVVAYNDDYYDSYGEPIVWTAPTNGTYYVAFSGLGFEERGSYAITLATWSGPFPTPVPIVTPIPTPTPGCLGGSGNGQFRFPEGIAVDGSGNVYVTDQQNHRVQVFNSSGEFLRKWGSFGSGDGQFDFPRGIAVDISGNVYVTNSRDNRVQVFSSSGEFLRKWGD